MFHRHPRKITCCLGLLFKLCFLAAVADAGDAYFVSRQPAPVMNSSDSHRWDQPAPVVNSSVSHRFALQADVPAPVVGPDASEFNDGSMSPSDQYALSPGVDYGVSQNPWLVGGGGGGCWWGAADYLALWTSGNPVPALVTTNTSVPPQEDAGVIGVGNTRILMGDRPLDTGNRSGVALTVGRWLDSSQDWGIQATWMYAGGASDEWNSTWQSDGVPVLARPFFNVASGMEDAQLVAYPSIVTGLMTAQTHSDLRSVEALLRGNWSYGTAGRIDVLGGYRYLGFHEGLRLDEQLTHVNPAGVVQIGTQVDLFDHFFTRNDFHGGTLGLLTSLDYGALTLDIGTKLGVGRVRRETFIDGQTRVETPVGEVAESPGGLLALPSNMGTYRDSAFSLLPELDLKARLMLSDRLSFDVGYQLLFLTQVHRTGHWIDRRIDAGQLPVELPVNNPASNNQTHPIANPSSSTLRAQGLTVGLTFVY